jgi:NhaP-type Na+/H+ or K+/H+ antiporter
VFEREADASREEMEGDEPVYSTSEGLIVLGTLLLAYGAAELVEGYGFLAVFVGALTARQRENASRYHRISHHFIDQIEQIVLVAVLLGFGAMLASGVLYNLTWAGAGIALLLIFVIRPLAGIVAEGFTRLPLSGKAAIAFLGVRGMGSIYYLAYGQNQGDFAQLGILWAIVSFAILVSVVVHGVVSGPLILLVERRGSHIHRGSDASLPALSPGHSRAKE